MSPSEHDTLRFRVRAEGWDEATRITVFDGHNRIRARGVGALDECLPKGLYQVRLERLGAMQDHLVIHDKATDAAFPPPRRSSAMPSTDTTETHEFYQEPGAHFSMHSTAPDPATAQDHARLMIMLRASGEGDCTGQALSEGLALFAEGGVQVTGFDATETARDEAAGWLIYSALLPAGNYLLVHQAGSGQARFLPLQLHRGWDASVFVPHDKGLRLTRASLDLVRAGRGFDPADRLAQTIDGAMQGLGESLDLLPADMRRAAIYGKFDHPLHGLIGAHAHFLGAERRERLEGQVLRNLWRLLPGSPDVIALLLMALEREEAGYPDSLEALLDIAETAFGTGADRPPPRFPLTFPPMLRPGLRALLRASLRIPGRIGPGSGLEAATLSSFSGGGAWSVWEQERAETLPVAAPDAPPSTQKIYAVIKRAISDRAGVPRHRVTAATRMRDVLTNPQEAMPGLLRDMASDLQVPMVEAVPVEPAERVRDLMHQVQDRARSTASSVAPQTAVPDWLIDYARDAVGDAEEPDATALAGRAGVPLRLMEAALAAARESDERRKL